ncbi:MAG: hypothetical protein AABX66_00365 [Nanoarchaeota archaeon]
MLKDEYGKYYTRPDKTILSEVLDRTIELDYLINSIIREYFDLYLKFDESNKITNMTEISNFSDFFSLDMNAYKKLKILKILRKELPEDEQMSVDNFDNKFLRIFEIRNIFAHSKIPKKTDKKWLGNIEEVSWEELNIEHKKICDEIIPVLMADF